MCGLTGFWSQGYRSDTPPVSILSSMTNSLLHRGPDSSGEWYDESAGVFFGHRRLAVIDLSEHGAQPMISASGRFVLVYNGEIYNHLELRRALGSEFADITWRGGSDTETLLAAIELWGLSVTLQQLNGMYAMALWDREQGCLTLARDKIGEKPLYYATTGKNIVFGSELRALREFPEVVLEVSRDGVAGLLANSCIPAPDTIYQNVYKLKPGCLIRFDSATATTATQQPYWRLSDAKALSEYPDSQEDHNAWQKVLSGRLDAAVKSRMIADVPLGSFLSGGIDSSLVTALMQKHSSVPVKTFSIGFSERSHNEAEYAKKVASYLETEHTEFYVSDQDVRDVIPELAEIWDEPFADSSQIPTYIVSKLTSEHVTVALSGDGGDELFAGYRRYKKAGSLWSRLSIYPLWTRQMAASIAEQAMQVVPVTLQGSRLNRPIKRLFELSPLLRSRSDEELYHQMQRHWKQPEKVVLDCDTYPMPEMLSADTLPDFTRRMMHLDTIRYLPDDILTKVDRASMAVSLETRAPLLDVDLVEFAWHMPISMKTTDGIAKYPLREELYKVVPRQLVERPKMGFAVPIGEWLRGPLKSWADDLLNESCMRRQGFLEPTIVQSIWQQHLRREWSWEYLLWDVLMFQSWLLRHHEK